MSVSGQVVVITGGAQGIGRFVARTFAAEGAKLVIADIAPMETVANEISQLEAEVLTVPTDVTEESQVQSLMDQVYRRWGRIDVFINDAGIAPHFAVGAPRWPRIRDFPRDFFDKIMSTNLVGTYLCTKHVLPYMESLASGHIINFGQGSLNPQRVANLGSAVYNVSKISIRAFTHQVAEEERDFNICIVSMGPGGGGPASEARPPTSSGAPMAIAGGIATEDSPEWARLSGMSPVDVVGNRYVVAAEAPMEFSGHQIVVRDAKLEIVED